MKYNENTRTKKTNDFHLIVHVKQIKASVFSCIFACKIVNLGAITHLYVVSNDIQIWLVVLHRCLRLSMQSLMSRC